MKLNWRMVTLLADFGFLMGALATLGYTVGFEWVIWVLYWGVAALILAKTQPTRLFVHGFAVGLLATIFATIIEVIFFEHWALNYPEAVAAAPINPQIMLLLMSIVIGGISGIILGGMTLAAKRLLTPHP